MSRVKYGTCAAFFSTEHTPKEVNFNEDQMSAAPKVRAARHSITLPEADPPGLTLIRDRVLACSRMFQGERSGMADLFQARRSRPKRSLTRMVRRITKSGSSISSPPWRYELAELPVVGPKRARRWDKDMGRAATLVLPRVAGRRGFCSSQRSPPLERLDAYSAPHQHPLS